jgi:tripartite-type tricarboxylate transporter receptor subunit TctC
MIGQIPSNIPWLHLMGPRVATSQGGIMKLPRRQFLHLAAGAAALPAVSRVAMAQAYPTRLITIVVPYAAGGPTDVIGRILAERMRAVLGQTVIVENVTGANGTIGVGRVARATPDGYTISIGHWSTHVVNGAIYQLPYDLLNDFEPISLIATNSYVIVAKNAVPANDLKGFIAWLKANPDKASEGTAGAGSPQHVGGVFFQQATGTRFQFVPYRGAAPAMQDLLAGQIDNRRSEQFTAACACRRHKGLCRHGQDPIGSSSRYSDGGRGGIAGLLLFALACALGA